MIRRGRRVGRYRPNPPTPEEKRLVENAKKIRALGKRLNLCSGTLQLAIHADERARRAHWPQNADRLQKVLEALWNIQQIREEARNLQ